MKTNKITLKKLFRKLLSMLPIRLSNDKYVSYFYVRPYRFITLIKIIQKLRINYWSSIASKYEPFKPFYCEHKRERTLADQSLCHEIKNIYREGYAVCSDFLDEQSVSRLIAVANSKPSSDYKVGYFTIEVPQDILEKILNKLRPFYEHFFPDANLSVESPSSIIRIDYSETGLDPAPITANWHVDRFIPTFNAIYFPEGSYWGSFEKDVGNPIINESVLQYFLDFRQSQSLDSESRDDDYKDLNLNKKVFDLPRNSLLMGTHHMQHRRSPYNIPGKRIAVFIDFYNVLPRKKLKNYA
jgi:hypothetical protein